MKSPLLLSFVIVIMVSSVFHVDGSDMCKRSLTKRLLKMIGVDPNKSPCLINTKREMARFIDTALDDIRERAFLEDEAFDLSKKWKLTKRGYGKYDGQYCCSPTCDRYMAHIGAKPYLVEC